MTLPERKNCFSMIENDGSKIKMKRLLISLDGGGVRGGITSSFLACIEKDFLQGRPLKSVTDAVAGCSAGAINAGLLSLGLPMSKVSSQIFCRDILKRTFTRTLLSRIPLVGSLATQFRSTPKLIEIQNMMGHNVKLSDVDNIKLVVTTYNWSRQSFNAFHNFSNEGHPDVKLSEAVHASSSPPYFFPCHKVEFEQRCAQGQCFVSGNPERVPGIHPTHSGDWHMDGGIACNTPDMMLLAMAKKEWPEDELFLLSIGTGHREYDDHKHKPFHSSAAGILFSGMFNTLLSASNELNSVNCSLILDSKHYVRIEHALPAGFNMSISECSYEHIDLLHHLGKEWFGIYRPQLREFFSHFA
jgi:patatin-like phospholipase/acyl hydrolase